MRVGVIGCGAMGRRRIEALLALGEQVKVWDVDSGQSAYASATYDVGLGPRLADVLEWADAVMVCTPPETHLTLAVDAARVGVKAIFVEKPLAMRAVSPGEMAALAPLVTMVGCPWRFTDAGLKTAMVLASGELGKLLSATLSCCYSLPAVRPDYRETYAATTGALFDVAWHLVDLAVEWLGSAKLLNVHLVPAESIGLPEIDGQAHLILGHDSGVWSGLTASLTSPQYLAGWQFTGTRWHETQWLDAPPGPEMYLRETRHFMACADAADDGAQTCNPIGKAVRVLDLLLEARARWQTTSRS